MMEQILNFQTMPTDGEREDFARVSTLSFYGPCPGLPSAFTYSNC